MIPYFDFDTFQLGPLTIHTWGFFVSLGFGVATLVAYRRARHARLDVNKVLDLVFWIIVAAFIGARFSHVFLYEWSYYREHLREIVRIDQGGLSSFGGFFGATVATILLVHIKRLNFFKYADVLLYAFPLGWGIGRFGCFLTHMHPGQLSSAWFAVQYPGGARLDMGLVESAAAFTIFVFFLLLARRPRFNDFFIATFISIYGLLRIILDFFRATDLPMADARYFGLTPAQYGSLALLFIGLYLWHRNYESRATSRTVT